ncbi:MAG: lipopolysaccharide biosynthesis protein [Actinomycetota bacterium]|nr:lipopolysaccharide biosynthesis protein [Actinomycetota bacterium]
MAEQGIATRTLRGMAWAYGAYVGGRVLVLVSTAVLARLLTPEDFGLVALALTIMAMLEAFADLGVGHALVVDTGERVEDRAETAFVISVAVGLVLALIVAGLSPVAAAVFDEPELIALTSVLGLNFLLRSFKSVHEALARKAMDFRSITVADFADAAVRGVVGIVLAIAGLGVWALVIGYLVGTLARTAAIWWRVRWRPRFKPRRAHLRQLIGFGGGLSLVSLLNAFIGTFDDLVVGQVLGATALGLYVLGFRLPELLIINMSNVASDVLFPAFASVSKDALASAYLTALRYTLMVGLPLAVGLAVLAEPVILALFGDQWQETVTVTQILTLYALGVTIGIPAGTVYKATGRASVLLKLAIFRAALLAAGVLLLVDEGIDAVAASQAAVASLFSLIGLGLATRLLSVGVGDIARAIWPAVLPTAGMAAVLLGIDRLLAEPWVVIAAGTVGGALAYLALVAVVSAESLRYIRLRLAGGGAVEGS